MGKGGRGWERYFNGTHIHAQMTSTTPTPTSFVVERGNKADREGAPVWSGVVYLVCLSLTLRVLQVCQCQGVVSRCPILYNTVHMHTRLSVPVGVECSEKCSENTATGTLPSTTQYVLHSMYVLHPVPSTQYIQRVARLLC